MYKSFSEANATVVYVLGLIIVGILCILPLTVSGSEVSGSISTDIGHDTVGGTVVVSPTISPASATYTSARTVTMSATGSSRLYYTTNGGTPSCGAGAGYTGATGTRYTSSFTVSSSATVKAISCYLSSGDVVHSSAVTSVAYTISTPSSGGGGGGSSSGGGTRSTTNNSDLPVNTPVTAPAVIPASTGFSSGSTTFNRDLENNSSDADVLRLQRFLNTHGYPVALSGAGSLNNETNFFGPATQAALARYQAANGISPAIGYFGPVTRAFVNGMSGTPASLPVTPAAPVSLPSSPDVGGTPGLDLTTGMVHPDVRRLQQFLNANGFVLVAEGPGSPGNETDRFGAFTREALARYQAANGISPAIGYFGPTTRAQMKAAGLGGLWW